MIDPIQVKMEVRQLKRKRDEPKENNRSKILQVVSERECSLDEIGSMVGLSYSTVAYHVERLLEDDKRIGGVSHRKIGTRRIGGQTFIGPINPPVILHNDAQRAIFLKIDEYSHSAIPEYHSGITRADLSLEFGITTTSINWHLRSLKEFGMIFELDQGRIRPLFSRVGFSVDDETGKVYRFCRPYIAPKIATP